MHEAATNDTFGIAAIARRLMGDVLSSLDSAVDSVVGGMPPELAAAANLAGPKVVGAASHAELILRIDEAVALAPWRVYAPAAHPAPSQETIDDIRARRPFRPRTRKVLGAGPALVLEQGFLYWAALQSATAELLARVQIPTVTTTAGTRPYDLFDLVNDPQIPAEAHALILPAGRSITAMFAIVYAIDRGTPLEPWCAHALCELFADGQRQLLRLIASTPGTSVSPAILPEAERLDLEALDAAHRARVTRYAKWFELLPPDEKQALDTLAAEISRRAAARMIPSVDEVHAAYAFLAGR